MDSLFEIEYEVETFARARREGGGPTLWEKLVRSSVNFGGDGCDGLLMASVQQFTEQLLTQLDDRDMHEIWLETENGILSAEEGYQEAERCEMTHDIALDVCQHVVETVCREARERMKKGRRT